MENKRKLQREMRFFFIKTTELSIKKKNEAAMFLHNYKSYASNYFCAIINYLWGINFIQAWLIDLLHLWNAIFIVFDTEESLLVTIIMNVCTCLLVFQRRVFWFLKKWSFDKRNIKYIDPKRSTIVLFISSKTTCSNDWSDKRVNKTQIL